MGWRNVVISSGAKLSLCDNQLLINGDNDNTIPIEDINAVVIENQQSVITAKLMDKLAQESVVVYICDEKHIPSGIYIPFNNHSRQAKMVKTQIEVSKPLIKRCWQQIVIQKIINQAKCLNLLGLEGYKEMEKTAKEVVSGDENNREAVAARMYFKFLFNDFIRGEDDVINAALNYGYSILRGAIARTISAYGFIVSLGIHHKSELNNFNLADDLIEPFRPIVDLWVAQNMIDKETFDKEDRIKLVSLLGCDCVINNERHSVNHAIDIMVSSLVSTYNNGDYKKLLLPQILPLRVHEYE